MRDFTANAILANMQRGDQLRTRIILKARNVGRTYHFRQRLEQLVALEAYLAEHGRPWDRQPWQFKGPTLAEMFSGRRMKIIPRELRRIHAPYP